MERKCERPNRACVVENGILKYMPTSKFVVIPSNVKVICGDVEPEDAANRRYGDGCFYKCFTRNKELLQVECPDTVEVIGNKAFENCHSLMKFIFVRRRKKSLKRIGFSAFNNCTSMQKIILPNTLEEIGCWAFAGISKLVIEFEGTLEEWNNIKKYDEWAAKTTLVFTKDNQVEPIIIEGRQ